MSKDFGVIGPLGLEESIALSTSNPRECVPWEWGNLTHLESAGSTCISLAKNNEYYGCKSKHGNHLSTIIYNKRRIVLCQIDNSKGMFVFSRNEANNFVKGFKNLIDEKIDLESALNNELNRIKLELQSEMKMEIEKNPLIPENILSEIKIIHESGILKPPNLAILSKIKKQEYPTYWISKEYLEQFIKSFYEKRLGGIIHTGITLYHLGLPTDHLIKKALDEQIEISKKFGNSDLEKTIRKHLNSSKSLFT